MKGTWQKSVGALIPVDDDALASIDALKDGHDVVIDVHSSRNPGHHRKFFSLLKKIVDAGLFDSVDDALLAIKIACGEVETWISPNTGQVYYIPRSISFERMDQARFKRLWDRAVYVICTRWLAGADQRLLLREINEIIDGPDAIGERVYNGSPIQESAPKEK